MSSRCTRKAPGGGPCRNTANQRHPTTGEPLCHWHWAFASVEVDERRNALVDGLPEVMDAINTTLRGLAMLADARGERIATLEAQVGMLTTQVQALLAAGGSDG